jgi:HlyD family secretion protein
MLTRNRKISLLTAVVLTVVAAMLPQFAHRFRADELTAAPSGAAARLSTSAASSSASWAAVAPGRVEPLSREIKIAAPLPGRIADVLVKANDEVLAGELLLRLDDEEALARLAAADAQVALRKRARNDQSTAASERRKAEDTVADSERTVADAQSALDKVAADRRMGRASQADLDAARSGLSRAQDQLRERQDALAKLKPSDQALPSRLEGELNVARAEWTLAKAALEKTRIRAPVDGTVLQLDAKKGELALPSSEPALLVLGDVSALRVRAELDEQYLGRLRVGQRVVVRAAAFRGREFDGKVSAVARIVGPGRINARGPRKLSDVDVLEAVVDLSDPGPLVVGEQVDVYFSPEPPEQAPTQ